MFGGAVEGMRDDLSGCASFLPLTQKYHYYEQFSFQLYGIAQTHRGRPEKLGLESGN